MKRIASDNTRQIDYHVQNVRYKCPRCFKRTQDKVNVHHPLFVYLCRDCAEEFKNGVK